MRTIITVLTAIISLTVMGQSEKSYKQIEVGQTSEVINVSADKLWEIIGPGFENVGYWSTAVDHATPSGEGNFDGATCNERLCEVSAKGFDTLKEVITTYDAKNRTLAYDVTEGLPGFVVLSNSKWQIIEVGPNQSQLVVTISMQTKKFMGSLMGGMMKSNINKVIPTVFRDLKIYAETGDISIEKKERMKKVNGDRIAMN